MAAPPTHAPGTLRDALIDAGLALLAEGGPRALTLRQAAARAGVSHAAPAHHFAGLTGLMTAMATRAHTEFSGAMIARRDAADPSPLAQLIAVCQGYLAFAEDRAGLFHLLFVSGDVIRDDPALMQASHRSYQVLRDACLPFSATNGPDPEIEIAVWSMVHGYALLGPSQPEVPARLMVQVPPFEVLLRRIVGNTR